MRRTLSVSRPAFSFWLLIVLSGPSALAWNSTAHKTITLIALRQLDEAKQARLVSLLRAHPHSQFQARDSSAETAASVDLTEATGICLHLAFRTAKLSGARAGWKSPRKPARRIGIQAVDIEDEYLRTSVLGLRAIRGWRAIV